MEGVKYMYNSVEEIPKYICEMCCECSYIEEGYCPYVEDDN